MSSNSLIASSGNCRPAPFAVASRSPLPLAAVAPLLGVLRPGALPALHLRSHYPLGLMVCRSACSLGACYLRFHPANSCLTNAKTVPATNHSRTRNSNGSGYPLIFATLDMETVWIAHCQNFSVAGLSRPFRATTPKESGFGSGVSRTSFTRLPKL